MPTNAGRRDFLVAGSAGLALTAYGLLSKTFSKSAGAIVESWNRLLRPPGALTETSFNETCIRCGQCMQVCPTKCLTPAGSEAGLFGIGTPRFAPRLGQCMFCSACGKICPTNALAPVAPDKARLGTARINHSKCLAWNNGTECLLCVETCPTFAIAPSKDRKPVIDHRVCSGCGACEANCPVEGSAVLVYNDAEIRRS
jgi:ferredoxin-type protein NapF